MRSSLLASINLVAMFVGCLFLGGAIAQSHWRKRGPISAIIAIVLCGQIWLIPQAVSFFVFHSTRFVYPLWFGNWIVLAFSVILFCLAIRGSAPDLSDAAVLDGAGFLATFRHVVWPIIKLALFAVALLLVMATWTEFAGPLVGIEITGTLGTDKFPALLLASLLATLPVIAIFFWAQRGFLRGATSADGRPRS